MEIFLKLSILCTLHGRLIGTPCVMLLVVDVWSGLRTRLMNCFLVQSLVTKPLYLKILLPWLGMEITPPSQQIWMLHSSVGVFCPMTEVWLGMLLFRILVSWKQTQRLERFVFVPKDVPTSAAIRLVGSH
ncbi:hypothetical protein D3C80_1658260 [compost metagenome]